MTADDDALLGIDQARVRAVLALGGVPWQDLDDGVQQVRLRLLERRATPADPLREPAAWAAVVASRTATDWHRSRTKDANLARRLQAVWDARPPDAPPDQVATALDVADLLDHLPDAQRQVLVLRYFSDLTVPEIARALVVPEGTVKSRLHGAMKALRDCLANSEGPIRE